MLPIGINFSMLLHPKIDNSGTGIEIDCHTAGVRRYNFTIPLLSILECNNIDKFIPIGSINNMQLF